jgi:5-methylcytosine-specific restriction endonuclease McrA
MIISDKKMDKTKAIWLRDGKRCRYCGKKVTLKEATQDHVYPKSKGGLNSFRNLVCSCRKCNEKKRNLTPKQAKMVMLEIPENYFRR